MTYRSQATKNIEQTMLDIVWGENTNSYTKKKIREIIYLSIYQSLSSLKNMKAWGNIFQELKVNKITIPSKIISETW